MISPKPVAIADRPGESDTGRQAEVERGKKHRDDRVDLEPDDQDDG
jgi:hypothetical protein